MHTPGPWTFGLETTQRYGDWEIDYPDSCSYRHIGANGEHAAPVAIVTARWGREADAILDANARLIAAAPDLYEALRNLVLWIETSEFDDGSEQSCPVSAIAPVREVHAAHAVLGSVFDTTNDALFEGMQLAVEAGLREDVGDPSLAMGCDEAAHPRWRARG